MQKCCAIVFDCAIYVQPKSLIARLCCNPYIFLPGQIVRNDVNNSKYHRRDTVIAGCLSDLSLDVPLNET